MSEQTEHVVDRQGWPAGPWDQEPEDRLEWRAAGLPCLMVRNSMGSWCGYVACDARHPWFEQGYDGLYIEVHGGLTYAAHCDGPICHVPQAGESDRVWWLGFDCAHYMDWTPALSHHTQDETYRDIAYVRAEVERLAEQVCAAAFASADAER